MTDFKLELQEKPVIEVSKKPRTKLKPKSILLVELTPRPFMHDGIATFGLGRALFLDFVKRVEEEI